MSVSLRPWALWTAGFDPSRRGGAMTCVTTALRANAAAIA
jgi:hypothetical protein